MYLNYSVVFCRDLPGVSSNDDTETPLVLIDTSGCGLNELRLADEDSKANEWEADIVEFYVKRLVDSGVKCEDIAVITPYNLQVRKLHE